MFLVGDGRPEALFLTEPSSNVWGPGPLRVTCITRDGYVPRFVLKAGPPRLHLDVIAPSAEAH